MTWLRTILLVAAVGLAAGCQGTPAATDGCGWTKPIRPSAEDVAVISDALVEQILVHNETGAALCGWQQ